MPFPAHKATRYRQTLVRDLSSFGFTEDEIATRIGVSPKTLRKHYRRQIDDGRLAANEKVARALFTNAIKRNSLAAQIFWLKARAGWSERTQVEVSGPGGRPLEVAARLNLKALSIDEMDALVAMASKLAAKDRSDGSEETGK